MTKFEDLIIWKEGLRVGIDIFKLTKSFDKSLDFSLGDQIRRASLSISSNIAEGSGAETLPDEIKFLDISIKSCFECISQLIFYQELTNNNVGQLIEQTKTLAMKIRKYRNIRYSYIAERKGNKSNA